MIMQTIRTVTNRSRSEGICKVCRYDDRHYVLFFSFPEQCSIIAIRRLTDIILSEVSMRLKQFINLKLSMGISDIVDGHQQWNRLFRQAERLAGLSFYQGTIDYIIRKLKGVQLLRKVTGKRHGIWLEPKC